MSSRPRISSTRSLTAVSLILIALAQCMGVASQPQAPAPIVGDRNAPHLTAVSVLLPPEKGSAFEIFANNGCYKWYCNNRVLVDMQEQNKNFEGCASSVTVTVLSSSYTGRRSTYVSATDTTTGTTLRCEVFVDQVDSLKLTQSTRRCAALSADPRSLLFF